MSGATFVAYNVEGVVGKGKYGEVLRATRRDTGEEVAIKLICYDYKDESGAKYAKEVQKETRFLEQLRGHRNVVRYVETLGHIDEFGTSAVVMELAQTNLEKLLRADAFEWWTAHHILGCIKQVLHGVAFCHSKRVIHRDLKPQNILYTANGVCKLCDFGMAVRYEKQSFAAEGYNIVTLWYRAPEILLGCPHYSYAIDVWSVGCLLAELLLRAPLLPGRDELEQCKLIWNLCGSPTANGWQEARRFSNFRERAPQKAIPRALKSALHPHQCKSERRILIRPETYLLLEQMLVLDPRQRITAWDALNHAALGVGRAASSDRMPRFAPSAIKRQRLK